MQTSKPQGGIIVREIDKYVVLKFSLFNWYLFVFLKRFLKLQISIKLEKILIFILQFDLEKPQPN